MLKSSSIPNEFYLGDKPGTLQYKKLPIEICEAVSLLPDNQDEDEERRWETVYTCSDLENTSYDTTNLLANTPTAKKGNWVALFVQIKSARGGNWIKSALYNKHDGRIALMTSCDNKDLFNKPIPTRNANWFVGHYRMSAPLYFWRELSELISELQLNKMSPELDRLDTPQLVRLTPENAYKYIGHQIIFKTRGEYIIKKIIRLNPSGAVIDHPDLKDLVVYSRRMYVIL
jgi:hypothetical protein